MRCTWPYLHRDCRKFCDDCRLCRRWNSTQRAFAPAQSIVPDLPMSDVVIDVKGPLPETPTGNRYVLGIIDRFSSYFWTYELRDITTDSIAGCLGDLFGVFGFPGCVQSDNASNLTEAALKDVLTRLGMEFKQPLPYHPQANGKIEVTLKTAWIKICKLLEQQGTQWDRVLAVATAAHNLATSDVTKATSKPSGSRKGSLAWKSPPRWLRACACEAKARAVAPVSSSA